MITLLAVILIGKGIHYSRIGFTLCYYDSVSNENRIVGDLYYRGIYFGAEHFIDIYPGLVVYKCST
jgi:hypothetical protein